MKEGVAAVAVCAAQNARHGRFQRQREFLDCPGT